MTNIRQQIGEYERQLRYGDVLKTVLVFNSTVSHGLLSPYLVANNARVTSTSSRKSSIFYKD